MPPKYFSDRNAMRLRQVEGFFAGIQSSTYWTREKLGSTPLLARALRGAGQPDSTSLYRSLNISLQEIRLLVLEPGAGDAVKKRHPPPSVARRIRRSLTHRWESRRSSEIRSPRTRCWRIEWQLPESPESAGVSRRGEAGVVLAFVVTFYHRNFWSDGLALEEGLVRLAYDPYQIPCS